MPKEDEGSLVVRRLGVGHRRWSFEKVSCVDKSALGEIQAAKTLDREVSLFSALGESMLTSANCPLTPSLRIRVGSTWSFPCRYAKGESATLPRQAPDIGY